MTHSYLMRSWAMQQMARGILGRDAIAAVCGVPPRTIASWMRAEQGKGSYLITTHREYERALGILLYDSFPHQRHQIGTIVGANQRTIQEWRTQLHSPRYQSEFNWATRLAAVDLNFRMKQHFHIIDNQITLKVGKLPDSLQLEEMIWQVYDDILIKMLQRTTLVQNCQRSTRSKKLDFMFQVGQYAKPLPPSPIRALTRLNGPHARRGATLHSNGHIDYDQYSRLQRENFATIKSKPSWLTYYPEIRIAEGKLSDTLETLNKSKIRHKKYTFKYGNAELKWSGREALLAYMLVVHPQYKRTKAS